MKLRVLPIVYLALMMLLFTQAIHEPQFSSNPPGGKTNAPGDTNCSSCHGQSGVTVAGNIAITGFPSTIVPGTLYPITITLTFTSTPAANAKGGFQAVVLNSGNTNSGRYPGINLGVNTDTVDFNARKYVQHDGAKLASGSTVTYTFSWLAPANATGVQTMYAAGILTNGNGGSSGDKLVTTSVSGTAPTSAITVTTTPSNPNCNQANGSISANATGGTGGTTTYAWSNGGTGSTIAGLASGIYTVTATNNGATGSAVTVLTNIGNQPNIGILPAAPVVSCSAPSITLTASGGVAYIWSSGQNTGAITVSPTITTTYTVSVTSSSACISSKSITVVVNNTPPTVGVSATNTTTTCLTPSTTITASGGGSYLWSTGANTATINATPPVTTTYTVTVTATNGCTATASTTIVANKTPPTLTISPSAPITNCANPSAILTATGGSTYAWSTAQNTSSITVSPIATTVYTVTATGANGCTASKTSFVNANFTVPVVNIATSGTSLTCTTPSSTLLASGGATYLWSNGTITNTNTVTPLVTTVYTVTATATNGCTGTKTVNIIVNKTPPLATISPAIGTLNCSNASVTFTANGGTTYVWSNANGGATTTVAAAGVYTVTVTGTNGCTATQTAVVNFDATLPVPNIVATTTNLDCITTSAALTATGGGSYVWSNTGSGASTNVTAPGVYTVTVTGANGCTASQSIVITQDVTLPIVAVSPTSAILTCTSPTAMFTATGGGTYAWSNDAFGGATITATTAGVYTVTVTGTNACTATQTAIVNFDATLPVPNIVASTTSLDCITTSATLTATGSGTYVWSNTGSSASTNATAPGVYTVTVTGANGCTSSQSIVITQNVTPPVVAVSPTSAILTCTSPTALITATGGGTYTWSNASNSATITVATAGVYSVVVTGANGCTAITSVVVTLNTTPPVVAIANPSGGITCTSVGGTTAITASGGGTYAWNNGAITATTNVGVGIYVVTATASNGCTASKAITVAAASPTPPAITTTQQLCSPNRRKINWTGPTGVNYYVRSRVFQNGSWSAISSYINVGQVTSYTTPALLPSTKYQYYVRYRCPANGPYSAGPNKSFTTSSCFGSEVDPAALVEFNTPAALLENEVSIFPNPTDGRLNIVVTQAAEATLWSTDGRKLNHLTLALGQNEVQLTTVPAGLNWLMVNTQGQWSRHKIVVE